MDVSSPHSPHPSLARSLSLTTRTPLCAHRCQPVPVLPTDHHHRVHHHRVPEPEPDRPVPVAGTTDRPVPVPVPVPVRFQSQDQDRERYRHRYRCRWHSVPVPRASASLSLLARQVSQHSTPALTRCISRAASARAVTHTHQQHPLASARELLHPLNMSSERSAEVGPSPGERPPHW